MWYSFDLSLLFLFFILELVFEFFPAVIWGLTNFNRSFKSRLSKFISFSLHSITHNSWEQSSKPSTPPQPNPHPSTPQNTSPSSPSPQPSPASSQASYQTTSPPTPVVIPSPAFPSSFSSPSSMSRPYLSWDMPLWSGCGNGLLWGV